MAFQDHRNIDHSTLEVQRAEHTYLPQAVGDAAYLEAVDPTHAPHGSEYDIYSTKIEHNGAQWQYGNNEYGVVPQEAQQLTAQKERVYCFGLSRKVFWIVVVLAAIAVIGALAGGLAGGLSGRNSSSSAVVAGGDNPQNSSPSNSTGPFLNSQLAAINWTDSTGAERRGVFYQNGSALLLLQTYGVGNAWTQVNISQQFVAETGRNILDVKVGTPLAAAAIPWQGLTDATLNASLFYINQENQVRELVSSSDDLSSWTHGSSWSSTFNAAADTRLSVVPYFCPTCQHELCIVFQDGNTNIIAACQNAWSFQPALVRAFPGTPLSFIQFSEKDGNNNSFVDELRLFYYTNTQISDYMYNHNGDHNWEADTATIMNSLATSSNGTVPQIVSAPADEYRSIVVVAMDGDGNFTISWYQNGWNINQAVSFVNENGKITSTKSDAGLVQIAMTYNHYLYGVTVDRNKIIEYSWTSNSPYSFNWTSNVATS